MHEIEPAVAQTEWPPIPKRPAPMSTRGLLDTSYMRRAEKYMDAVEQRIASLTQRLQEQEAREAELEEILDGSLHKYGTAVIASEAREAELQARMEALERSHKALLDSVEDILGYTGGADSALEDEYVMERLHANWAVAQKLAAEKL